jgi:AcrR family transcriptional regulator
MTAHPHFRWVRPARQARSLETTERLLDSAEELIAEKGFRDVPVAEIARRAGFSVGAFYARFRDKEGMLRCLEERFLDEARATADDTLEPARWEGSTVYDIVREMVAFLVRIHRERGGVLREILALGGDPEIREQRERLIARVCDRLSALVLARRDEVGHPDPDAATRFSLRLAVGLLSEAMLSGDVGAHGVPRSDDRLIEELVRTLLRYLEVRPAEVGPARS